MSIYVLTCRKPEFIEDLSAGPVCVCVCFESQPHKCTITDLEYVILLHISVAFTHTQNVQTNVQQEQFGGLSQRKWPLEQSSARVFSQFRSGCGASHVINSSAAGFQAPCRWRSDSDLNERILKGGAFKCLTG